MPFVDLHGTRVRYREAGASRAGPPLLFIHGAGASSAVWLPLLWRLGRVRRAVALDLPGHGRSGGAVESIDEMRDAVGGAAAALCLGPSVLVGHSMGGLVALAAALAWPDKVAGLVLVTTGARLKVGAPLFEALASGWGRWPELFAEVGYSPETPADVRRRGAGLACAASQEQTIADFRACTVPDYRGHLAGLAGVPTLVVAGEHDVLVPTKVGKALAEGIPRARCVVLPRCGHMAMQEEGQRLAGEIIAFLGGGAMRT